MIRLFVRHLVADFEAWKKGYRAFGSRRRDLGVEEHAYFRGALNPNDVTVWHDFRDLETAQSFVTSSELAEAMDDAGVEGEPQIWFVEREKPE